MIEQWWCISCPKCKHSNWLNNGDPSDQTAFDVEGCRCWNCGHCWKLSDEFDDEVSENDDPIYEDGRHFEEVKNQ